MSNTTLPFHFMAETVCPSGIAILYPSLSADLNMPPSACGLMDLYQSPIPRIISLNDFSLTSCTCCPKCHRPLIPHGSGSY